MYKKTDDGYDYKVNKHSPLAIEIFHENYAYQVIGKEKIFYWLRGKIKKKKNPERSALRTFARNFSNIDFFLKILLLKDDELAMSEM